MCVDAKALLLRDRVSSSLLLFICLSWFGLSAVRIAAQTSEGDAPRRVKVAVKPQYSDLAKRLSLSGTVRVEVQIAADGKVKKAHVVGGHPVLALDAEKAALLTEFEPGPKETTQIIEFRIGPAN